MASAMSLVRMPPEAPTSAPAMIRTGLPMTKPAIAAAVPVNELSSEMTTGMSAPPMGRTMVTPKSSPARTTAPRMATLVDESRVTTPAELSTSASNPTTATAANRKVTARPPGMRIGLPEMTPCSLPEAISEPEKVTQPMTAPRTTKMDVETMASGVPTMWR